MTRSQTSRFCTSVLDNPEARATVVSGFIAWLLFQSLFAATELLTGDEVGAPVRALALSLLVVSFQAQRSECFGARYWLPLLIAGFELLQAHAAASASITAGALLMWLSTPLLLCLRNGEGRLRALEAAYPVLERALLQVSRVDHLRPRLHGFVCRPASLLLEQLRRWCAGALNRERSRSRASRLLALNHSSPSSPYCRS